MSLEPEASGQGDRLLWMAAGVVAVAAFVALALIPFWPAAENGSQVTSTAALAATTSGIQAHDAGQRATELLNRAGLALDAGMLLEPRNVSAWHLYKEVIALDPENAAALAGLAIVADRLLEQARDPQLASAEEATNPRELARIILRTLPDHPGALAMLDTAPEASRALPKPVHVADVPATEGAAAAPPASNLPTITFAAAAALGPAPALNDPIPDIYAAFEKSLKGGNLTLPADDNAKEFVKIMRVLSPMHDLTARAESELFEAFMQRFEMSFDDVETAAASQWLSEADLLAVDAARVARGRKQIARFETALEAAGPLPAAELKMLDYVPPEYPQFELERGIEGWVDVEFTVTRDGRTRDIAVTNASHETTFTNEAVFAVALWRFEPHTIMGKIVEQRAFTRIRFAIE